MMIEGQIVDVMETWPLQLTVETDAGTYHVMLKNDTLITLGHRRASPHDIRPGLHVRVEGQRSDRRGIAANRIDITKVGA